jgi:hypothetical protein
MTPARPESRAHGWMRLLKNLVIRHCSNFMFASRSPFSLFNIDSSGEQRQDPEYTPIRSWADWTGSGRALYFAADLRPASSRAAWIAFQTSAAGRLPSRSTIFALGK